MQKEPGGKLKLVQNVLPWLLGIVALVCYVLTVNPWVSFFNLSKVAEISGWTWGPELSGPAYYLVTLPLRWLPVKWIPLGLNLFSALCAALTLAQLARSVALLPHDRTHEQRLRENNEFSFLSIPLARLPPVLAVLVCGLQLTFWEHATNGTGEMFDLLLFSYVIRSLLEYRIDRRESRLLRTAFIYGISMTNNFAMVGFFPGFVGAVLWIRGWSFFNIGFLLRMMLSGLAGLSLYLLLPLLVMFQSLDQLGFWAALKANLGDQFYILFRPERMLMISKRTVGIFALTSLLPMLIISIRWASYFGDSSRLGNSLATLMFHIVHVGLLVACIWVAFDPPFSPRQKGAGLSFLTFYYLAALSIGYLSGYLLLVFRSTDGFERPLMPVFKIVNRIATGFVFVLLILSFAGLMSRNLPQMQITNGPALKQFAGLLAKGLPQSAAVLSDHWYHLLVARSWLADQGRDGKYLFIHTQSLLRPAYQHYLDKEYPKKWETVSEDSITKKINPPMLALQLLKLSKETDIYYLHPSFGYYFEVFYPKPHGLALELKRYEPGVLLPPHPVPETVAENEAFWSEAGKKNLKSLLTAGSSELSEKNNSTVDRLFKSLHVPREKNFQNSVIGSYCARALNYWGVEMQRLGELEEAARHFEFALRLNPDNVVAQVNLECNKNLRGGAGAAVKFTKSIEENLGRYRSWDQAVNANGPYDEPALCYSQGWLYIQARHYRQAAINLNRVTQFLPDDIFSRIGLSHVTVLANFPDNALSIIEEIHNHPERFTLTTSNIADLVTIEAAAWFQKKDAEKAKSILEAAVLKYPDNDYLLAGVARTYLQYADLTNALVVQERRLSLNPNDMLTLVNKAYIHIELQEYNVAITTLNRALTIEPTNNVALLDRAIAYLRVGRLDKAEADYKSLETNFPNLYQIQYGLGEIAWQRKDTNTAIRHYKNYLTNAPPTTEEAKSVADRLRQLKGGKSK